MKRLLTLLAVFALATATFAQNNTIAVPAPKTMNIGEGNEWIPLFIQGVITTNFQNYSGMKVVDRQNSDMVKAEQRLSENAEFSDADAIEMGKMTHAHLIVTGSITGKSTSYALMFSITDAETGETKASATVPNCLFSALENGDAANQISYDLMTGYGISLSADAKKKLTQKATVMTAENTAQASVAKGIVAEQSGSNIEALTYYIQAKKNDKKLSEATSRMANMTTVVSTGNFGKNAKNMIKLRNDWDKLLWEATALIAANPPVFQLVYYDDLKTEEIDYDKGTLNISVTVPDVVQCNLRDFWENEKLVKSMKSSLAGISESKNWGEKINGFPWSYADDVGGDNWLQQLSSYSSSIKLYFNILLLNSSKKVISEKKMTVKMFLCDSTRRSVEPEDFFTGRYYVWKCHNNLYKNGKIIFESISVDDADTDNMFISITNTGSMEASVVPKEKIDQEKEAKTYRFTEKNKKIKEITIPEGYERIDWSSFTFTNIPKVEKINLPESIMYPNLSDLIYDSKKIITFTYPGSYEDFNRIYKFNKKTDNDLKNYSKLDGEFKAIIQAPRNYGTYFIFNYKDKVVTDNQSGKSKKSK